MQENDLEAGVAFILRDLLEDDSMRLDTAMGATDLPGWDSFMQVEFVAALEDRFSVQIPLQQVERWRTIEDVLVTLREQLAGTNQP